MTLDQITVTGPDREPVDAFSITVADAESTATAGNNHEVIQWSTTGEGFQWVPNTPVASGAELTEEKVMGDACATYTPEEKDFREGPQPTASCVGGTDEDKTGTYKVLPFQLGAPQLGPS